MSIQFVVKRNDTCVSDQNEFAQLAGTFARKAPSAAQSWVVVLAISVAHQVKGRGQ